MSSAKANNGQNARLGALATAVPEHRIEQEQIAALVPLVFRNHFADLDRLLPIFKNTQVKTRYLSQPVDWYLKPHSFADSNRIYEKTALQLARSASEAALRQAGVSPGEIGMVVLVSTTGLATPSLDAKLIQALGIPCHARRLPLWGLGCAGGVSGLARAAELVPSLAGSWLLFVAVELCSLTFQIGDPSKANLIATSLFSDGAAALLLSPDNDGPEIVGSYSHLFPDSEDIMGWDVGDNGLKVRLSRDLPSLVRGHMSELLAAARQEWGVDAAEIRHYVIHPGGAKVLSAFEKAAGLETSDLAHSYFVLHNYGNMSSPSVLFALREFLDSTPKTDQLGLMLAFGPGFSAEQLLFRW
jgi:alkylresorcinol/alkylpyrone synthase